MKATFAVMTMVGIAELKANLSTYLRLAKRGHEIGVQEGSEVVARLLPCSCEGASGSDAAGTAAITAGKTGK